MKCIFKAILLLALLIQFAFPHITFADDSIATPSAIIDTTSIVSTPSATVSASNAADVTNNIEATSNTGNNSVITTEEDTSTPQSKADGPLDQTPSQSVTIQTGDAVSVVAGDNAINTASINSDVTDQTINIFGDQTGDIDLSTLFQLVSNIITSDSNNNPTINVQVTGVNNYAYLSNDVISTAHTGGNTVNGGDVIVSTGNAESVVSLINKVNLTVVNSSLHMVTINIFGHLTGNIILPNLTAFTSSSCTLCGVSFNANNQAVVNNDVVSTANTGNNTITASTGATLTTGNAYSQSDVINLVNKNILGTVFENLFINTFGNWSGSFLGWDGFGAQGAGNIMLSNNQPTTSGDSPDGSLSSTNINNVAYVNNNISSLANTGSNTISGQQVNVTTGNTYSAISLVNLINSNFFKSLGFFGFINIFGNWDGNIGGADKFITPTPTPDTTQDVATSDTQQEVGGALSVENSNNVGSFIYPGDTVTFFIKTKNIGTGKVYGAKLHLHLIHNGQDVGGSTFTLGDIPGGRGVKVTTGLVIAKDADPGSYIARADVSGTVGPDNSSVSASADSNFTIQGSTLTAFTGSITPPVTPVLHKAVLGSATDHNAKQDEPLYLVLLGILIAYVLVRVLRAKDQLVLLFTPGANLKSRLNMLRLFLL